MKRSALVILPLLIFSTWATAASAQVFECVSPDGKVKCTVRDTSGNPSVTCNHDCPDCNMVCAARETIHSEDGMSSPPPPIAGRKAPVNPGVKETPAYCKQQLDQCTAACNRNPMNKSSFEVDACISSCRDTFTGCGMMPKEDVQPPAPRGAY